MTHAYRVPVVGGGSDTTESVRSRVARGRPNWWVILAVSLGLMALLVATAGSTPQRTGRRHASAQEAAGLTTRKDAGRLAPGARTTVPPTTTTTAAPTPTTPGPTGIGSSLLSTRTPDTFGTSETAPPTTTTTPPVTTTTTTLPNVALPADRTQTQGYLDPPVQTSNQYGFTGTGAMAISVLWSGDTYLTMQVTCPSGSQSVGGTSAMAASLPDATGSCLATVHEPASESASLTYTISIGPAGG